MPIIHVKSEVEYNKYVSQGKLVFFFFFYFKFFLFYFVYIYIYYILYSMIINYNYTYNKIKTVVDFFADWCG